MNWTRRLQLYGAVAALWVVGLVILDARQAERDGFPPELWVSSFTSLEQAGEVLGSPEAQFPVREYFLQRPFAARGWEEQNGTCSLWTRQTHEATWELEVMADARDEVRQVRIFRIVAVGGEEEGAMDEDGGSVCLPPLDSGMMRELVYSEDWSVPW